VSFACPGLMIAVDRPSRDVSRARGPQLRQAGDEALPFAELHAAGITFPAAVVSELEPNGYVIQRVCELGQAGRRAPARARTSGHILGAPLAHLTPIANRGHLAITADCPGLG